MEQKDLLLVQIGPVQEFIAAARELSDLWSGSYLIAHLTAIGIKHVEDQGGIIVFPCLEKQDIYQRLSDSNHKELGQPTLPNRFCAEVPHDRVREIADEAKDAIRKEFQKISSCCFAAFSEFFPKSARLFHSRWDDQVWRFLQMSWQAVPLEEEWGKSYEKLLKNLAARRNTRDFQQYAHDPSRNGTAKDALNGQDEIVFERHEWEEVRKRNDCYFLTRQDKLYGAVSIIKRLWRKEYLKNQEDFPTLKELSEMNNGECPNYVAAIQMDGDHMGAILSNPCKDKNFFSQFSRKLANFTRDEAAKIIKGHKGVLIYAGGDDVLALLPACNAVDCALELRNKFCENSPDMPGSERDLCKEAPKATLSAGIAFGHHKIPIARLLAEARNAEHRAKESYGRDALALTIVKRSGEIAEWGAKFDSAAWDVFKQFHQLSADSILSSRFAYALARRLREYIPEYGAFDDPAPETVQEIIWSDFLQVCKQQKTSDNLKIPKEFEPAAENYLSELFNSKSKSITPWEFPQLFLCGSFLMRKNDGQSGE